MPFDLDFDPKNKSTSVFDTEQLRLRMNEKARLVLLSKKIKSAYAHYIVTGSGEGAKGRYYECLGDPDVVKSEQIDPEHCPACRVAVPGRDVTVPYPRRRCAVYIARYRTNPKGQAIKPISLALQIFIFAEDKLNKLLDRAQEHGDLTKKDLIFTCTAEKYQNMDIDVSPNVAWHTERDAATAQLRECQKQMRPDMDRMLCTTLSFEQLETLLNAHPAIGPDDTDRAVDDAVAEMATETFAPGPVTGADTETLAVDDDPVDFDAMARSL